MPTRGTSISLPLAEGDEGTCQTIAYIRQLVDQGVKNAQVNRTAVEIVRPVAAHDHLNEVRAVYEWVHANVRFVRDIINKETLRPAHTILEVRAGDCDDINGILLPSLLGTIGYATRLVTVASNPTAPDAFSHVYAEVLVDGRWIPLDAARPGVVFGMAPARAFRRRVWSLADDRYQDVGWLNGMSGYIPRRGGLGFDWGELIKVIPGMAQATTQIITAARVPSTYLPYLQQQTALVTPTQAVSASGVLSTTGLDANTQKLLMYGGLALLAVLLMTSLRKG